MSLRLIRSLATVACRRSGMRCTTAAIRSSATRSCPAWSSTAACARAGAGRRATPALCEGDALVAAAPGYLKGNSHGEFVFDHAWAHAYAQLRPGLLPEVAGAPCPTRRSPGRACWRAMTPARRALLAAMRRMAGDAGCRRCTSISMPRATNSPRSTTTGWRAATCSSTGATTPAGATSTSSSPRWTTRSARTSARNASKVARAGVTLPHRARRRSQRRRPGRDAWLLPARPSPKTAITPALTLDFLRHLARTMPRQLVLVLAEREATTDRRRAVPARRRHAVRPLLGRQRSACPACISRPATTRASNTACAKACTRSNPARRASTRSPAASCRRSPTAATGSPIRDFADALARLVRRRNARRSCAIVSRSSQHSPVP